MSTASNVLAGVTILGVLGVSAALTLGGDRDVRLESTEVFTHPVAGTKSLKVFDWSGDKVDDVFVQGETAVAVLDARGGLLFSQDLGPGAATTLTDVDGDGRDDIVTAAPAGTGVVVSTAGAKMNWSVGVNGIGAPQRIGAIRFESGPQLVVVDALGNVAGIKPGGVSMWGASLGDVTAREIRGLDEARAGKEVFAIVATRDGIVAAFDSTGHKRYQHQLGTLRRMRTYDLDGDGNTEILVGGDESGTFFALGAADGARVSVPLGQPITELREVEADGDPTSREIAVGGKKGGVWALTAKGAIQWTAQVDDKVSDILSTDVDGDGKAELVVADEGGHLAVLKAGGGRLGSLSRGSAVARLDTGALGGKGRLVVADATAVALLGVQLSKAPILYTPLAAGVVISLFILFAAWFVHTLPARTGLTLSALDQSPEALVARRRMLHESLSDVERVRKAGEVPADAYLARVRALREELLATEAAMTKANIAVKPQVFACPRCGGPLQVGVDRCDFCGQGVVL